LKKLSDEGVSAKVRGGSKGKKKPVSKGRKGRSSDAANKKVEKIMKYTPSRSSKKEPTPSKGKISTKRPSRKHTPAMPSPGGKKSIKTSD